MDITLRQLQQLIHEMYGSKDQRRGAEGTFMWFMEEVGELASALRGCQGGAATPEKREALALEFADVLAWLTTLANIAGVDLDQAVRTKYVAGCPGCRQAPCECDQGEKP